MDRKLLSRPWLLVSLAWIGPAIFGALETIAQRSLRGAPSPSFAELLWSFGDWFIYAFITPLVFWISNRWPIVRPHLTRRILIHAAYAILFCFLWAIGGKLLQLGLDLAFSHDATVLAMASPDKHFWANRTRDLVGWIFVTLPFGVVVYMCVAGAAHAFRYFVDARDREVQLAQLAEQVTSARFAALQSQLNPHFLFNALNTIAVRARDGDGAGTARMVEQLSDLLRQTLSRHRATEVTLGDELDLVNQYLAIEQARFSDRLRPEVVVDGDIRDAAVPTLALQHLVENAIRHGVARRTGAGRVRIEARRDGDALVLTVQDDGPGATAADVNIAGHGLANTRERLSVLYGDRASLDVGAAPDGETVATLRVPYRELAHETDVAGG